MFEYLKSLWNTPALDISDTTTDPSFVNMTKEAVATYNAENSSILTEKIDSILFLAQQKKAFEMVGVSDIKSIGVNKIQDSATGKNYDYKLISGIPSIRDVDYSIIKPISSELTFDETDQMDYNNRYVSMDAARRNNDCSDVAFLRIVKSSDGPTWKRGNQVFPNPENGYLAPGISKSKFRQFIVMSISEASNERMQIVETSEEFQLLFYGKRPEVLQIQGILKNTIDNPWSMNMLFLWDNYMRGTKLAEHGNILQLYIDGDLYSGYPFGFQRSKSAPNDFIVNFSFSFIITERLSTEEVTIKVEQEAANISEYGLWGKML